MNNNPTKTSKLIACLSITTLLLVGTQAIQAQDEMVQTVTTRPKKSIQTIEEKPVKPLLREEKEYSDKIIKLNGEVSITQSDEIITLSLRDSDTRQVLRMLADKAGLNIIFHDSVSGLVTLDLVNTPLNKAFEYIMTVNSLQYWVDGDTLVVASLSEAGQIGLNRQEIQALKVKYLSADAVAKFLNSSVFGLKKPGISNEQTAVVNPRTNEVLIFGTQKDIDLAKKVIAQIDVEPDMKTFELDHITPQKMAELLCQSVFKFNNDTDEAANSDEEESDDDEESSDSEEKMKANEFGGGEIACQVFFNSGNSSGGSSSGGGEMADGEVAAMSSGSSGTNSLASLEGSNISVVYYPELGKVTVIGATVEQNQLAANLVKLSDKKQPQAYIEMSIIELSEQGSRALSSTWGFYNGQFGLDLGAESTAAGEEWDGRGGSPVDYAVKRWVLDLEKNDGSYKEIDARIPGGNYLAGDNAHGTALQNVLSPDYAKTLINNLSFVVSHQMGRVLTNPRIIATNNQTSTINLSSDYIKKITTTVQTGSSTVPVTTKNYEIGDDNGIKIELTPTISPKGYVVLSIKPDYKTIKSRIMSGTEILVTLLQTRTIELKNIRVKDGHTLVIGGLIQEVETKSEAKVPVLGDLPFIGAAFRSTTKTKEKSELMILVTPKILTDEEDSDTI